MSAVGKPHPKAKFTPAEDVKLRALVQFLGTSSWNKVAEFMGTRNARQCRDRYKNYLAPNLCTKPWTLEDDEKLNNLINTMGKKWSQIAKEFPGRTDINIKSRWMLLQRQLAREKENSKKSNNFFNSIEELSLDISDECNLPVASDLSDITTDTIYPDYEFRL